VFLEVPENAEPARMIGDGWVSFDKIRREQGVAPDPPVNTVIMQLGGRSLIPGSRGILLSRLYLIDFSDADIKGALIRCRS